MKRTTLLLAVVLGLAGCGTSDNGPSVSQVTVTAILGTTPVEGVSIVASSAVDSVNYRVNPADVITTQTTNSAGKTTFTVPSSTTTGLLCFSWSTLGGFASECRSLNALEANTVLTL